MKAPRESDLVAQCLALLTHRRVFHWRQNQGAIPLKNGGFRKFVGMRGLPDILGVLPSGRLLAIECKQPGRKTTAEQRLFLDTINKLGALGLLVRDVADLDAALADLEQP